MTISVREYLDSTGHSPFARWFTHLDSQAAAKVAVALYRLEAGNSSEVKGVGGGVFERRIHHGPGYRIYFGKDGDTLIILLAGGDKSDQPRDIKQARERWRDYKNRKHS